MGQEVKDQGPWRRERGRSSGHQGAQAGRTCHNGGTSSARPSADTARPPEAHAPTYAAEPQIERRTNHTGSRPADTGNHTGKGGHTNTGGRGYTHRGTPPRTPPHSPPPRPHRQATTQATARATTQAPEEEEGAATAPRARGKNPQRTRDQSTGPQGGQPRGHLPDPPARAAHLDPHSKDPAPHPTPNYTPQPPASHTPTRTPQYDTGRTNLHRPNPAQHEATRHTAPQRTTVQHTTTGQPKTRHTTAQRGATRHSAAHHSTTVQHGTTKQGAPQHSTDQHDAARRNTARHSTAHHSTPQHQSKGH